MTRPDRPGAAPDAGRERWRATLRAKALRPPRSGANGSRPPSGIEVHDLYTPADIGGLDEDRDLGRPGEFPFTRGVQPTMYRSRFWTMRQYAGFATAEETNRRFRYLLEQGQTGLSVAFDLPTQMGYDSDAREAYGEVGRVGVPISSLADMTVLLDGLPLGEVSTSMTINATAPILLALYVAAAEAQGVPRSGICGTTQNDILKEYIARGTYIFPPRPSMRLVTDVFEFCAAELPEVEHDLDQRLPHARGRGDGGPGAGVHARGRASPTSRRRSSAASTSTTSPAGSASSSRPGRSCSRRSPSSASARRMWATIMQERFGASNARSMLCRFHVQTAGRA